jgi:addiction module RelE/StbE family toxin
MDFEIVIKESAKDDILETILYYENVQSNLGQRFISCLEKQLESLEKEPFIHQKKYKDFRQVLLRPFPYHIIYEIEGNTIVVYKVVYAGKHPLNRYIK